MDDKSDQFDDLNLRIRKLKMAKSKKDELNSTFK